MAIKSSWLTIKTDKKKERKDFNAALALKSPSGSLLRHCKFFSYHQATSLVINRRENGWKVASKLHKEQESDQDVQDGQDERILAPKASGGQGKKYQLDRVCNTKEAAVQYVMAEDMKTYNLEEFIIGKKRYEVWKLIKSQFILILIASIII